MRLPHVLTLLGLGTLCLSCADSKPASIVFTAPPPLIVSGKIIRLDASVANRKGEPIGGPAGTRTAPPAGGGGILSGGGVRCLGAGGPALNPPPGGASN